MHINYFWRGVEEPLGSPVVTASNMSVDSVEDEGATLSAKGHFTFQDHVEGCYGESPWVATGKFKKGKFEWVVRRRDPYPDEFAFMADGEPLFCLGSDTNLAIKKFIAEKLTRVVTFIRENPGKKIDLKDQPEQYTGITHKYTGPCVCQTVVASSLENPFDWNAHTNGGQHPANCFKCSCGNGWYRGNPEEEHWVQVGDPEAWYMLLKYNGVATEILAFDPENRYPLLMLQRTIRKRGFIPIP